MINKFKTFFRDSLNTEDKNRGYVYLFLSFIQSILDLFAISSIIPLIIIFINNSIPDFDNFYLNIITLFIKDYIGNLNFIFVVIFSIFFLKYLLTFFINYFQINYSNDLIAKIRIRLINNFLNIKYSKIFNMNSNIILNGIILNAERAIEIFYIHNLLLIKIFFHLIIFIIFLSTFDFKLTLLLSIIIIFFLGLYYFLIKDRMVNIGKKKYQYHSIFVKNIQEIFNGFHIVKLFNLENQILKIFNHKAKNYSRVHTLFKVLNSLPKISQEIGLITILILMYFLLKYLNYNEEQVITYITIFGIISLKLLPQLILAFNIYGNIKNSEYAIDILNNELSKLNKNKDADKQEIVIQKSLEVKNFKFYYNEEKKLIFEDLNFMLKVNDIIGIRGVNGSGKSTLLKALSGLITPENGEVLIDENKVNKFKDLSWKNSISYIEQDVFLFNDTLIKNITLKENLSSSELNFVNDLIDNFNLRNFVNSNKLGLNQIISENNINLSGGEKQKIAICRAFFKNSKFIFLDETFSNLDRDTTKKVKNYIKNLRNKGIVIVSHNLEDLDVCNRNLQIENGKIFEL